MKIFEKRWWLGWPGEDVRGKGREKTFRDGKDEHKTKFFLRKTNFSINFSSLFRLQNVFQQWRDKKEFSIFFRCLSITFSSLFLGAAKQPMEMVYLWLVCAICDQTWGGKFITATFFALYVVYGFVYIFHSRFSSPPPPFYPIWNETHFGEAKINPSQFHLYACIFNHFW